MHKNPSWNVPEGRIKVSLQLPKGREEHINHLLQTKRAKVTGSEK